MSRCFISYSRRNTNFAERLARDLNDAGVEVWIDFRQIHAGERWKDEIRRGVERSEVIVIVLSPDSVVSEWVQFEINYGREKNKVLLPIMVVDCYAELRANESLAWLLDVHFIKFEGRYEQGFPGCSRRCRASARSVCSTPSTAARSPTRSRASKRFSRPMPRSSSAARG
ncbi:MAG: toll/interleukin-1 receptor domain-containing protein [Chloroflexi bacterium]|nr:toll/interleukin-1 receptor domain-containing protein [Chloroflexota bacterium]